MTVFSNRYEGHSKNISPTLMANSYETYNLSSGTSKSNTSAVLLHKNGSRIINYFVYQSLYFDEEQRRKDFTFYGKILNFEIPNPYRAYAYIRIFENNDNIINEEMYEIDRSTNQFAVHKDSSSYSNYEFLQYGILIKGPHSEKIQNPVFLELGYLEPEGIQDVIEVSISPSLINMWTVLTEEDSSLNTSKILINDHSDERELKIKLDQGKKSLKIEPDFTLWLSTYED